MAIVNQINTGTISKVTLGKLLRDCEECMHGFFQVHRYHLELNWTVLFCGESTLWFLVMGWIKLGAGIAQWLERRTRDWKVTGSNPCWSGRRIFFSRVNFLWRLLYRYPFHLRVTAVACKRPRSSCQKCRWQVTAKHAYTLRMWLCMKWHGAWLYGVHRMRRDGSSFLWHQPCTYTTLVDIQKTRCKKLFTHVESHASTVCLLKSRE